MIIHRKLILHFEVHWGYWPRAGIHLESKPGSRVDDAGLKGTVLRCPACSGDGVMLFLDERPEPAPAPWDGGTILPGSLPDPWGR